MPSILVIDDNAPMVEVVRRMLVKMGHEVTTAFNGKEAMQLLAAGPLPDIVITDLIMPEQEGMETINILRESFPTVKIIAMSGGGHVGAVDYLTSAKDLGAHQTLQKPFSIAALESAVASVIARE